MEMDLQNNIEVRTCISSERVTDNTAQVGAIIDRANTRGLVYAINIGTIADGDATVTVLVEEGDNSALSDAAAVADADLIGTEAGAAISFDDDDEIRTIGYNGTKRYNRLTLTPASNTGNLDIGAVAILAGHRKLPQSSQT